MCVEDKVFIYMYEIVVLQQRSVCGGGDHCRRYELFLMYLYFIPRKFVYFRRLVIIIKHPPIEQPRYSRRKPCACDIYIYICINLSKEKHYLFHARGPPMINDVCICSDPAPFWGQKSHIHTNIYIYIRLQCVCIQNIIYNKSDRKKKLISARVYHL